MRRLLLLVELMRACGLLFARAFFSVFVFVVDAALLFGVPRSGSGARGLIKAPAGDSGAGPRGAFVRSFDLPLGMVHPPTPWGGWGGWHRWLLDLPVRTDTNLVGVGLFGGCK